MPSVFANYLKPVLCNLLKPSKTVISVMPLKIAPVILKDTAKKVASGCKLCSLLNHSTSHCRKYATHEARTKRVLSLCLCVRCLSSKHTENSCPGVSNKLPYQCQSCRTAAHVTPMCPSMVLSLLAAKSVNSSKGGQ